MPDPGNEPASMDTTEDQQQTHESFSVDEDICTAEEGGSSMSSGVRKSQRIIKKTLSVLERKRSVKECKARQLRRLRKSLMPKNAIMALHELQGPGRTEFTVSTNGNETKAETVINNVKYEATAPNKYLAKAKASEKALRDLICGQMIRAKQQQQQTASGTTGATADASATSPETEQMECIKSEDLPLEHLAAFALHKLFTQWESEGFEVPHMQSFRAKKPAAAPAPAEKGAGSSTIPKVPKTVADLPLNANTYHPTALFAYMRPQSSYENLGTDRDQLNGQFIAGLRSDGHYFIGKGRSKKLARKAAAADACKELFGVLFDESVLKH